MQSPHVRWLLPVLAVTLAPLVAAAAPASDPAFLGIGMMDAPPNQCRVSNITQASPAHDAGIQLGDAIITIDGKSLTGATRPCDVLAARIADHHPGDHATLEVFRGGSRLVLTATLSSRSDVLFRRLVGEPMARTEIADIDNDELDYDLGTRGGTRIVGWFTLANCNGCARTFDLVSDRLRKRFKDHDARPSVLAVTAPAGDLNPYRKAFTANVPLAVADEDLFDSLALRDSLRITFMVIDCRGVVRFVAPVAPDADDLDAAVDDVLAAVEQAEHQRTSRR